MFSEFWASSPLTWPSGRGGSSEPGGGEAWDGAALPLALEQADGDGREGLQARSAEKPWITNHGQIAWDGKKGYQAEKYSPKKRLEIRGSRKIVTFYYDAKTLKWSFPYFLQQPQRFQYSLLPTVWNYDKSCPQSIPQVMKQLKTFPPLLKVEEFWDISWALVEARDSTGLKGMLLWSVITLQKPSGCIWVSRADVDRHRTIFFLKITWLTFCHIVCYQSLEKYELLWHQSEATSLCLLSKELHRAKIRLWPTHCNILWPQLALT